jgi:hypothetical protein
LFHSCQLFQGGLVTQQRNKQAADRTH